MGTILRDGFHKFEVLRWHESRPEGVFRKFYDLSSALNFLRGFMHDSMSMLNMRSIHSQLFFKTGSDRMNDHQVIEQLAWRLKTGWLKIMELPLEMSTWKSLGEETEEKEDEGVPTSVESYTHWIEYRVVDVAGEQVGDLPFKLQLTDGQTEKGRLPVDGRLRREGIPAGKCELRICDIEKAVWKRESAGMHEEVLCQVRTTGFQEKTPVEIQVFRLYQECDVDVIDSLSGTLDRSGQLELGWTYTPEQGPPPEQMAFIFKAKIESVWRKSNVLTLEKRIVSAKWERREAFDGQTLSMEVTLQGIPDGAEATFRVYEKDWMTEDDLAADSGEINAIVQNNRIETSWTARWQPDDETTGGEVFIECYFEVQVDGLVAYSDLLVVWPVLDVAPNGPDGRPAPNTPYKILLPDGTERQGSTDSDGRIREAGLKEGLGEVILGDEPPGTGLAVEDEFVEEIEDPEPVLDDDGVLLDDDGVEILDALEEDG